MAERDRTIPLHYQQSISRAYGGPKHEMIQRSADHVVPLNAEDEQVLQREIDWLFDDATHAATRPAP